MQKHWIGALVATQAFMSSAAFSADLASLQRMVSEQQCPPKPITYDLEGYSRHCGSMNGCSSFSCASEWNKCSGQVDRMNDTIIAYNSFVKKVCVRKAGTPAVMEGGPRRGFSQKGIDIFATCDKETYTEDCDDKYKYLDGDFNQRAANACHKKLSTKYEHCVVRKVELDIDPKVKDDYATLINKKYIEHHMREREINDQWEKHLAASLAQSKAEADARERERLEKLKQQQSMPVQSVTPLTPRPQITPAKPVPRYDIPADLRTNCGGNGLYLIYQGRRRAFNVVCGGSPSYCQSNYGGGQYVVDNGDRICLVP